MHIEVVLEVSDETNCELYRASAWLVCDHCLDWEGHEISHGATISELLFFENDHLYNNHPIIGINSE